MYNRVNHAQKQRLILNSYLPGIITLVFPNRHYDNIFSVKLINELHDWMEDYPSVINSPNVSYSLIVKINGTVVKKNNHIIQISVQYLHNCMILPISQGLFWCKNC